MSAAGRRPTSEFAQSGADDLGREVSPYPSADGSEKPETREVQDETACDDGKGVPSDRPQRPTVLREDQPGLIDAPQSRHDDGE